MTTPRIMLAVAACLIPGAFASAYCFGAGVWWNLAIAATTAAAFESTVAKLRRQPLLGTVGDVSGLVTAALIALALPPSAPAGVTILAVIAGLGLGKHVYGGLGANLFNPAMVGYAIVLVSFPADLSRWPALAGADIDGITGATALDVLKHRGGQTIADVWSVENGFGRIGALGHEWVNAAYCAGGLALVALRIADWRIPLGMLGTLTVLAALCYDGGSSASLGSPAFHLFSGATMIGAFFIATDPVTAPADRRGRWLFGALVGALVFLMRSAASYPDGLAFAVLLANAMSPLLEVALKRSQATR